MIYQKLLTFVCLLFVAPLLFAGCSGPDISAVSGRVTINGTPLTTGSITFSNTDAGISSSANIGSDGTYCVKNYKDDGLPPGEYKIAIKAQPISKGNIMLVGQSPPPQQTQSVSIPPKYQNADTSGFTAVVKKGQNEPFDFDLK